MASGYGVGSQDLDDIFAPYLVGTKPPATGFRVGAQDLRDRYAPLAYGQQAAATGYRVAGGADLNTLFAAAGTTHYPLPVDGDYAYADGDGFAQAEFVARADGTYVLRTTLFITPAAGDYTIVSTGSWNRLGGTPGNYEIRYTLTDITYPTGSQHGTLQNNDAPGWTQMNADQAVSIAANGVFNSVERGIQAVLHIECRRAADNYVYAVADVNLSAHIDGTA